MRVVVEHAEPLAFVKRYDLGAQPFIEALRASGRRIGVFSDYPTAGKLAALGIEVDIARDAAMPDIGRLKPHPRGFERVAELLSLPPSRCLIIGDRDGEAGRRGGFQGLLRAPGAALAGQFANFGALTRSLVAACETAGRLRAKEMARERDGRWRRLKLSP